MTLCNMLIYIQNIFHTEQWNQLSRYCVYENALFFFGNVYLPYSRLSESLKFAVVVVWFCRNKISKDCFTTCFKWTSIFKKYVISWQWLRFFLFLAGYSGWYWRWTVLWGIGAFKIDCTKTRCDMQGSFTYVFKSLMLLPLRCVVKRKPKEGLNCQNVPTTWAQLLTVTLFTC